MYIYTFLTHLQLYPIDISRFPLDAFYYGIYSYEEIVCQHIPHNDHHQYYLVYSPNHDVTHLCSMGIDEEMQVITDYQKDHLILPRKTSIYLDEAILEGLRLYDEFVSCPHSSFLKISLEWPTEYFVAMLDNGQMHEQPTYAYFNYNPLIYQLAYERFVYFIKMYCYYRLKTDRQGYPVKNFDDSLKSAINMYMQKDHHTYHIYSLTHLENKEFDLFLSQICSSNDSSKS